MYSILNLKCKFFLILIVIKNPVEAKKSPCRVFCDSVYIQPFGRLCKDDRSFLVLFASMI